MDIQISTQEPYNHKKKGSLTGPMGYNRVQYVIVMGYQIVDCILKIYSRAITKNDRDVAMSERWINDSI